MWAAPETLASTMAVPPAPRVTDLMGKSNSAAKPYGCQDETPDDHFSHLAEVLVPRHRLTSSVATPPGRFQERGISDVQSVPRPNSVFGGYAKCRMKAADPRECASSAEA